MVIQTIYTVVGETFCVQCDLSNVGLYALNIMRFFFPFTIVVVVVVIIIIIMTIVLKDCFIINIQCN